MRKLRLLLSAEILYVLKLRNLCEATIYYHICPFNICDFSRSSLFYWAFKKALRDIEDPLKVVGPKMLSDSILKVTDSLPFKSIGAATQLFTLQENLEEGESMRGTVKSSMEIKVAVVGSSMLTTSSKWRTTEEYDLVELELEKTEVLESPIASILNPFIQMIPKDLTDNFSSFPSGAAFELVK